MALLTLQQADLDKLVKNLQTFTGLKFDNYLSKFIEKRVYYRIQTLNLNSHEEYLKYLKSNPKEIEEFLNRFTINHTYFFRDSEVFKALKNYFKNYRTKSKIRVWSAACATGDEAYTVALILDNLSKKINNFPDFEIVASDIDKRAIKIGKSGVYSEFSLHNTPDEYIKNGTNRVELRAGNCGKVILKLNASEITDDAYHTFLTKDNGTTNYTIESRGICYLHRVEYPPIALGFFTEAETGENITIWYTTNEIFIDNNATDVWISLETTANFSTSYKINVLEDARRHMVNGIPRYLKNIYLLSNSSKEAPLKYLRYNNLMKYKTALNLATLTILTSHTNGTVNGYLTEHVFLASPAEPKYYGGSLFSYGIDPQTLSTMSHYTQIEMFNGWFPTRDRRGIGDYAAPFDVVQEYAVSGFSQYHDAGSEKGCDI